MHIRPPMPLSKAAAHVLLVLSDEQAPRRFPIGPAPLTIGRVEPNDIILDSAAVSRHHCMLELAGDRVRLTDLESTSGTFIDGERLVGSILLTDGVRLQVGPHSLRYERERQADADAALRLEKVLGRAKEDTILELLRHQTALARFGEFALTSDDLDAILTKACFLLGETLGTDLAKVMELLPDGKTLFVRAGVGWKPGIVGEVAVQLAENTSESHALRTAQPMISRDIATETRFHYPPFLTEHGVKAVANVAIIGGHGRPAFGILQINSRKPRDFTPEDVNFLRSYANLLAAAVDRLRVIGEVREGGQRLRLALEAGELGSWTLDPGDGTMTCTPRYHQIFGYLEPPPAWSLDSLLEHVLPEYRGHVAGAFRRATEIGAELQFECRIRRAGDGKVRWIETRGRRISSSRGTAPADQLLGIVSDITERKQVDDALHRSNEVLAAKIDAQNAQREVEERFRFATQAGRLGVWELDLRTDKLTASPVCKDNFGQDREAIFTYPALQDRVHADDRENMREGIRNAVESGADFDFECRVTRSDGEPGWVQMYAQVVCTPDGVPARMAGISLDITARMQSAERMRQGQRLEALGQLTAGVAHDFNNVLQSLLGNLELIFNDLADQPGLRADVGRALQAGRRGARLTSQLLSFSGQQVLRPTPLELPPLLGELSLTLRRTLGHDVTVQVEIAPDLPCVIADAAHLEAALLNLSLNARDAMHGRGQLRIEASKVDDRVVIAVTDSGEGMTPDVLAHACEPFFSTKGLQGTGLGLSMVHGFAYQSGGELRIRSTLGQGTRIEIWLPVEPRPPAHAAAIGVRPSRGKGRVLVVDDNADVALVTAGFLKRAGFEVTTAADGFAALTALGADPKFDAMVTDHAMPGMNGAELVSQARLLQANLPALIITGRVGEDWVDRLPPGVPILRKPFQLDELVGRVKALVEGTVSNKP